MQPHVRETALAHIRCYKWRECNPAKHWPKLLGRLGFNYGHGFQDSVWQREVHSLKYVSARSTEALWKNETDLEILLNVGPWLESLEKSPRWDSLEEKSDIR